MEIWLDTCDSQLISKHDRLGIIYGVTTNPSILAEARDNYEKVINDLLEKQEGPLAIQVTAHDSNEMIKQAIALHAFSDRIIVKIPVVQDGLEAMKILSQEGISLMATAVFHPKQALLAAVVGADYIAPYVSRMFDAGIDSYAVLQEMMTIYRQYGFKTKILAAALRTVEQITTCAVMGVHAVTLKNTLFSQLIEDDSLTLKSLQAFSEDWNARHHQMLSALSL